MLSLYFFLFPLNNAIVILKQSKRTKEGNSNLHFVHDYNCSIYLPIQMVHKVNDEIDTLYHQHTPPTHTHTQQL